MAFVIPSAAPKPKLQDTPGPADYNILSNSQIKLSCAPFGSSAPKDEWCGLKNPKKMKKPINNNNNTNHNGEQDPKIETAMEELPGPGQYNPQTIAQVYRMPKTVAPALRSKVPRFIEKPKENHTPTHLQEHTNNPDEMGNHNASAHKSPQRNKSNTMLSYMRNNNNTRKVPSIKQPNHYVRVIYTDPHNSESVVSKYVNTNFVNKNIGPGDYDLNPPPSNSKNVGASWGKSKVKRFHSENSRSKTSMSDKAPSQTDDTSCSLGPGAYSPKTGMMVKEHYRHSSAFASQGVRSYFDNIVYNTNIQEIANLRSFINYRSPEPGPGSYNPQKPKSFVRTQTHNVYQFFGSTSERFIDGSMVQLPPEVGPGTYEVTSDIAKHAHPRHHTMSALNKFRGLTITKNTFKEPQDSKVGIDLKRRISVSQDIRSTPGPGQYTNDQRTIKDDLFDKFRRGYRGEFGVREQRFKSVSPTSSDKGIRHKDTPGPGQYNVFVENKSKTGGLATYISQSKRPEQKEGGIPFGTYNVDVFDLGNVLNRKKEFLENLKRISVVKPPFESGTKRFKTENSVDQNKSTTYYEDNGLNVLSETAQQRKLLYLRNHKKQNRGSIAFVSQSKRFLNTVPDLPPPGHYHVEKELEKPSYNLKYGYRQ